MSAKSISSTAKPPATTLPVICIDPNDPIEKIFRVFQIHRDAAASREEQQEQCFQKILETCRQGAWEQIQACEVEVSQLTDRLGRSLLFYSITTSDQTLSQELISRKVGIHPCDSEGNTTLHAAARMGDLDTISMLYKHISIDAKTRMGKPPYMLRFVQDKSMLSLLFLPMELRKRHIVLIKIFGLILWPMQ